MQKKGLRQNGTGYDVRKSLKTTYGERGKNIIFGQGGE
jgi:hypothetical protein